MCVCTLQQPQKLGVNCERNQENQKLGQQGALKQPPICHRPEISNRYSTKKDRRDKR
jgi:hypothetical protein